MHQAGGIKHSACSQLASDCSDHLLLPSLQHSRKGHSSKKRQRLHPVTFKTPKPQTHRRALPRGSYPTPFLRRPLFTITDHNHKTRYPKKGVGYDPLGNCNREPPHPILIIKAVRPLDEQLPTPNNSLLVPSLQYEPLGIVRGQARVIRQSCDQRRCPAYFTA